MMTVTAMTYFEEVFLLRHICGICRCASRSSWPGLLPFGSNSNPRSVRCLGASFYWHAFRSLFECFLTLVKPFSARNLRWMTSMCASASVRSGQWKPAFVAERLGSSSYNTTVRQINLQPGKPLGDTGLCSKHEAHYSTSAF